MADSLGCCNKTEWELLVALLQQEQDSFDRLSQINQTLAGGLDINSVTPGTGPTDLGKAEDAPHTSGDVGVFALAVRQDANSAMAGDGDYSPLQTDSTGNLKVSSSDAPATVGNAADIIVAVAGTRVQGAALAVRGVIVTAYPENIGTIYVGGSAVTNASGSIRGLTLVAGGMSSEIIPISNVNQLYVNADNATDRACILAL